MNYIYTWSDLQKARLQDYERGWYAIYNHHYLFYGIIPKMNSFVNGVVFPIFFKEDLQALNKSELEGKMYYLREVTANIVSSHQKIEIYLLIERIPRPLGRG